MSTRIKMKEAVGSYVKDECYTIEDDAVAKRYIAADLAEDAPAPVTTDLAGQIKGMFADAFQAAREEFATQHKSKGPRIEGVDDPDDPREPPHKNDTPDVRKAKFGHWLSLIGNLGNPEINVAYKQYAVEQLDNTYKCAKRVIDPDEGLKTRTNFGQVQKGQRPNVQKAASIEGSGPQLGYLVPVEFVNDIWKIAIEESVLATRAKKRPMSTNEMRYPKLDQTHTQVTGTANYTSVSGYTGGVVARWTKETAARPETEPKIRQGTMKAGELTGYSVFGNELMQDAQTSVAAMVQELFGEACGYYLDLACLTGDGLDKPVGVVSAPATLQFTRAGGAGTATIAYNDLTAMKRRIIPRDRAGSFWAITVGAEDSLFNIKDLQDRPLFLPNANPMAGPLGYDSSGQMPLLGFPYFITEKLPIFGSTGDFMLISPKGYMIGERMGLEIASSPHVYFNNNETVFRFIARVAGQPFLDAPYTYLDGTTQASHFVALV